jgi:hypothetical protein
MDHFVHVSIRQSRCLCRTRGRLYLAFPWRIVLVGSCLPLHPAKSLHILIMTIWAQVQMINKTRKVLACGVPYVGPV